MPNSNRQEPVFELIKSMSKAEKRNFKLYATRLSGNQDAKFLMLFDVFDALDEYDEGRILKKCPVKKEQLPNMKAHLYKQILVSMRLLNTQKNTGMQLREQIDFAQILYNKGHYRQSFKLLEKAREIAAAHECHMLELEIIDFQKNIETLRIDRAMTDHSAQISREAERLCTTVSRTNELSNISVQLYGLYLKLGYVRSEKDLKLVTRYFKPRLDKYSRQKLSYTENIYYCQSRAWYNYILHNFRISYRYACKWIDLYEKMPHMKTAMYDNYLKGYSRLMEGLFFMGKYRKYAEVFEKLSEEREAIAGINRNAATLYDMLYYYQLLNLHLFEGNFREGTRIIEKAEAFITDHADYIDLHHKMLFYYKFACMYFGNDDYRKCIDYLQRIISTRDPQVRRDLQCYARILNLIASYEAGIDYNIDYQIKAVYAFLVKMNDLHHVQQEMILLLKRLNTYYHSDFRQELKNLYERLLPYTSHPYERRTFYYLDIMAWLESKIKGTSVADIVRKKWEKAVAE